MPVPTPATARAAEPQTNTGMFNQKNRVPNAKATITMITVVHAATESPWPGSMWFSDIKSPLA
jgi:hypothetical protein